MTTLIYFTGNLDPTETEDALVDTVQVMNMSAAQGKSFLTTSLAEDGRGVAIRMNAIERMEDAE